jgi:hypothetical protein
MRRLMGRIFSQLINQGGVFCQPYCSEQGCCARVSTAAAVYASRVDYAPTKLHRVSYIKVTFEHSVVTGAKQMRLQEGK